MQPDDLTVTLNKTEVALIMQLLDQPLNIKPSQMPEYFQVVQGIASKLNPQAQPAPASNKPTPGGRPLSKDDPRLKQLEPDTFTRPDVG